MNLILMLVFFGALFIKWGFCIKYICKPSTKTLQWICFMLFLSELIFVVGNLLFGIIQ